MCNKYRNKDERLAAAFKRLLANPKLDKFKNYDFTNTVYEGSDKPLTFRCSVHDKEITVYRATVLYATDNNKCPDCAEYFRQFVNTESFIVKSKRRFNDFFDYSKVEDYGFRKEVTLICPIHGEFKQIPKNHLVSSTGCTECGINYAASISGYSKSEYIKRCNSDTSSVYVIKITGNNEVFYKVGITSRGIENRFKDAPLPEQYTYEIVKEFKELSNGEAYDLESILHSKLKEYKYKPRLKFVGHTECFEDIRAIF